MLSEERLSVPDVDGDALVVVVVEAVDVVELVDVAEVVDVAAVVDVTTPPLPPPLPPGLPPPLPPFGFPPLSPKATGTSAKPKTIRAARSAMRDAAVLSVTENLPGGGARNGRPDFLTPDPVIVGARKVSVTRKGESRRAKPLSRACCKRRTAGRYPHPPAVDNVRDKPTEGGWIPQLISTCLALGRPPSRVLGATVAVAATSVAADTAIAI
jgi:hypothetical protein